MCLWEEFSSVYALKNHVAEGWVGSSHDRSPECRQRLGIAYIISDASHLNPYQSVLATHAMRVVSRSSDDEPSTSVEEQCVTAALGSLNRIAPDKCEALLSSDCLSGLMALKKACMCSNLTARHGVRTKEAGVQGLATFHIQQMCARGVDFRMMHEAACHNREKNGTTDFSQTVMARQNHACDLLAGAAAQQGRSHELDFYGALRPQDGSTTFLSMVDIPMFGDLIEQVGRLAQQVRVTRRLNKESRQPACDRSKATRVMPLMENGKHWAQVCKQLRGNLKAEAMRSCLGQLAFSSLNLSTLTDCADAKSICNLLQLGETGRQCHFCVGGPESRVHWCLECPAWQPAFVQVALTASAHLATDSNSLWFRPDFRLGFAGLDCKMISDKEAWMKGSDSLRHNDPDFVTWQTRPAVPAGGMGKDASVATKERITCLCGLWGQTDGTSRETCAGARFQQAVYEVLYECVGSMRKVLEHNKAKTRHIKEQSRINGNGMRFNIVGHLPLEIIAWLRDVFDLEQQVVTSDLTLNCLFPVVPSVLGSSWGDSPVGYHRKVIVDNFCPDMTRPVAPWSHRCLVILNGPRDGALSRVWEKITATARLRRVVVVIHERPGQKRLPRKH